MIIAANFKTNHTRESTSQFLEALNFFLDATQNSAEIRVFPPFTALKRRNLKNSIKIGAQNFYPVANGSFTGEIGLDQLNEFEVASVLIGHSERREILKESNEFIAQKFSFIKETKKEIIFCIGEPYEVHKLGLEATMEYLLEQFNGIDIEYENLIVAYEPIWAIGTGESAKIEIIEQVLKALKAKLPRIPLLYGGSVSAENIEDILFLPYCDGVLVGKASFDVSSFCTLIELANKVQK
ncbi:MAG: triose-phosphate isomerase [Campylobacteraceae bacterium]